MQIYIILLRHSFYTSCALVMVIRNFSTQLNFTTDSSTQCLELQYLVIIEMTLLNCEENRCLLRKFFSVANLPFQISAKSQRDIDYMKAKCQKLALGQNFSCLCICVSVSVCILSPELLQLKQIFTIAQDQRFIIQGVF